jgi:ATP-dependent Clp protease ATP-binding subunit ClpC
MPLPDDEPAPSSSPPPSSSPSRALSTRTARTHVLISSQFDGNAFVHPVTSPDLGSYDREDDALAEQALFLREHFARSAPDAISRLALPADAALIEVAVSLPREDLPRKLQSDVAISFPCVLVPSARPRAPEHGPRPAPDAPDHDDVWVMIPTLHHTFYVERAEPLEDAIRAEIRRIVAAQDLSPWEQAGLLPGRAHRLEVLEIPLPDVTRGGGAERLHKRLAERARRKQAMAALRAVATPLRNPSRPLAPLVARDAELAQLGALLDGKERLGVLLVGPEHAGKSALVRAWLASSERPVFSTSGAQLIAGMSGFGQWQERIRDVMEAVDRLDAILYFESLDDLLAERVESGGADLAGAMRPWLDEGKVRIVAEIRPDRLDGLEGRYWAFFAGLSRLRVDPLSAADTQRAVERLAAHDARTQPDRPRVAPEAIPTLVDLAERYLPYGAFPGKAVRLYQDLRAAHEQDLSSAAAPRVIGKAELYQVFSITTGVPEFLLRDDTTLRIEDVAARLRKQVVGQERAILGLAETIGVVKAGLQPSGKPLATFLFIGPTGVGKTELGRALAGLLFGAPDRMVRFDMSEFMTPDAAERLIRGTESSDGLLTRKVREQPFCVILLDEIEKAHPAVFDLLLQVAGEGRLTDAAGRTAYFHNAILIMTSNLGAADKRTPAGFTAARSDDFAHYQRLVQSSFRQEFVNRIDRIVPFRALTRPEVLEVAAIAVERMKRRSGLDEAGNTLTVSVAALARFAEEGYSEAYGARSLRRHLDEALAAPLARLLSGMGGEAKDLAVEVALTSEPPATGEGVVTAGVEVGSFRFEVRRPKRARSAEATHDHDRIAGARREVDRLMRLGPVAQMKDHVDFLVTQLNLSDREKADRRMARDAAELQAEHHRLRELWSKLVAAQEEVHAVEELGVLSLFEGQPVQPLVGDAEKARLAFRRVLPYALCALEPRRDEITLMIEELDEGALRPFLKPLLDQLGPRGWTAIAHVDGGARLLEDGWPPVGERRWGPPRSAEWLGNELATGSFKTLLFRCRGPYAGVLLALEAGLHRTFLVNAKKSDAKNEKPDDDRRHVSVRTLALRFDVPADAWADKHLAPPPVGGAAARKRGPAARVLNEPEGWVGIAQGRATVDVDPSVYWARLEEIALEHLLLFESGALDRDDYFAPAAESGG